MPKFVASYDLNNRNNPHTEFLQAAETLGWVTWVQSSDGTWYRLPNTTLRGDFDDHEAAVKAFKAIKPKAEKELGSTITVEKWIVAGYSGSSFDSDEKVTG